MSGKERLNVWHMKTRPDHSSPFLFPNHWNPNYSLYSDSSWSQSPTGTLTYQKRINYHLHIPLVERANGLDFWGTLLLLSLPYMGWIWASCTSFPTWGTRTHVILLTRTHVLTTNGRAAEGWSRPPTLYDNILLEFGQPIWARILTIFLNIGLILQRWQWIGQIRCHASVKGRFGSGFLALSHLILLVPKLVVDINWSGTKKTTLDGLWPKKSL